MGTSSDVYELNHDCARTRTSYAKYCL